MNALGKGRCLLLIVLSSCSGTSAAVRESCRETCQLVDRCSLMPSLLGTSVGNVSALENCQARCEDSPADRDAVRECLSPLESGSFADAGGDPSRERRALWCADAAGDSPCEQARRCLRSQLGGATFSVAEVSVELRRGLPLDASYRFPDPRQRLCDNEESPCCEAVESPLEERFEICADLGIETLQVSLLQGEHRTSLSEASLPCREGVDRRFHVTVETGKVQALVEASGYDPVSGASFCHEWYSPAQVATPAARTELAIQVPSLSELQTYQSDPDLEWPVACATGHSP